MATQGILCIGTFLSFYIIGKRRWGVLIRYQEKHNTLGFICLICLFQDVYGHGERLHRVSLAIITYIGCGVSFVTMFLATILLILVK